jgi:tRNA nucleotidyltransferase (CCA-adding enzyme)
MDLETLEPEGRRLTVGLAVWLHRASTGAVEATLDRLWLHRWKGYPLRERTLQAVQTWAESPATDAELRRLSTRTEIRATARVAHAVRPDGKSLAWLERARELGFAEAPPEPILKGRHLKELQIRPGPAMGTLLKELYELQLDGNVETLDDARNAARRLIGEG